MIGNGKFETAMARFLASHEAFQGSGALWVYAFQIDELDKTIRSDSKTLADRLNRFAEEETLSETPPTLSTLVNDINVNTALLKAHRSALYELIRAHFGLGAGGVSRFMMILSETV
jgi:hypothetical protein